VGGPEIRSSSITSRDCAEFPAGLSGGQQSGASYWGFMILQHPRYGASCQMMLKVTANGGPDEINNYRYHFIGFPHSYWRYIATDRGVGNSKDLEDNTKTWHGRLD
jgi:hypothetical protein